VPIIEVEVSRRIRMLGLAARSRRKSRSSAPAVAAHSASTAAAINQLLVAWCLI